MQVRYLCYFVIMEAIAINIHFLEELGVKVIDDESEDESSAKVKT
jgi:hypothetical protein